MADDKPEPEKKAEASSTSTTTTSDAGTKTAPTRADRRRGTAAAVKKGTSTVRSKLASLLWLVAVVCALFLAVGALLVALKANQDNAVVTFILDGADTLDLGVFSREDGIFTFAKDPNQVKSALVNWGLAALAFLVVGKIVDRVIRP
ncbi:hypothetical protein [Nocardioides iriomotensis]|uniref:hypothetical protein n=1 Tax=Nocardioides iriomotensis TaxID=715784 RepID=UPI001F1125D0|nr:hypothetical protein [Nocardioides iriomotensis]